MIVRFASWAPVAGLTLLVFSQRKSASRSYVWPSAAITGSRINSRVMEHTALSLCCARGLVAFASIASSASSRG
eukprot:scaffold14958_cov79-Phaeocystis_antarctica.AAC.3